MAGGFSRAAWVVLVAGVAGAQTVSISFQDGASPSGYQGTRDTTISTAVLTAPGTSAVLEANGKPDAAALLKWDLTPIPAGAQVQSASLTVYVTDASGQSYEVYELLRTWDEATATWNSPWASPGAQRVGVDRGSSVLATIKASSRGRYTVALGSAGTAAVQRWVDQPTSNFGVILQDYRNTNGLQLSSSEASTLNQRPVLTVTYATSSADAGTPDAGTDAGTPDAGTPDAGVDGGVACTPQFGSFGPGSWPPGCWRPYADTSPFNRTLPANPPIHPNSSAIMARIQGDISQYDYPQNLVANVDGNTGEPTYYPRSTDPEFVIHCTAPWGTCVLEGLRVRIPAGAQVEHGVAADPRLPMNDRNDAHLTAVNQDNGWEYDLWQVQVNPIPSTGGTLNISWGGITRIDGDGTASLDGATGSNVGSLAGRIRAEEFMAGEIRHALSIVVDCTNDQYVYPAKKRGRMCSEIGLSNVNAPPMGTLLQLGLTLSEVSALPIPDWKKTLLRSMVLYGMYIVETGSNHLFAIEQEAGNQYQSLGYPDPWLEFAQGSGWSYWAPDQNYVGSMRLDADGLDWSKIWSKLRVIDPCWASGQCG